MSTPVSSAPENSPVEAVETITAPAAVEAVVPEGSANGDGVEAPVAVAPASKRLWRRRERTSPSVWRRVDERIPGIWGMWRRYALAFVALGINIYSVQAIRHDYYSAIGSWGWLFSLVLLLVAFFGERRRPVREVDSHTDIIEQTDSRIPRKVEVAIFLVIFLMGLGLRLLNLGT